MTAKVKNLKQTVTLTATPLAVYQALLSSKEHAEIIGDTVKTSDKVGGKTIAYDGWIEATNVLLVPGKKIVQSWRGADWPKGIFSEANFVFKATKTGCTLTFTQTGIPVEQFDDIKEGWGEHYWVKMKAYFIKRAKLESKL